MDFMVKENRDAKARELEAEGKTVRKTSIKGQQLHPMYVEDWPHELSQADKGFGNTLYKTYFPVLYQLEVERTDGVGWPD